MSHCLRRLTESATRGPKTHIHTHTCACTCRHTYTHTHPSAPPATICSHLLASSIFYATRLLSYFIDLSRNQSCLLLAMSSSSSKGAKRPNEKILGTGKALILNFFDFETVEINGVKKNWAICHACKALNIVKKLAYIGSTTSNLNNHYESAHKEMYNTIFKDKVVKVVSLISNDDESEPSSKKQALMHEFYQTRRLTLSERNRIDDAIVCFICEDFQPISVVENNG